MSITDKRMRVIRFEFQWTQTPNTSESSATKTKVVKNQLFSHVFQLGGFLWFSAEALPRLALLSCHFFLLDLQPSLFRIVDKQLAIVNSFCLKTKEESRTKNRQQPFGMPLMGYGSCSRRKQLILITNVQSEEEDRFGPSSKPLKPNIFK